MFDFLAFIIGFFLISFLVLIILIGFKFLYRLFNVKPSETTHTYDAEDSDREIEKDSIEDSQGDGLMGIDEDGDYSDILFPEEDW